MIRVWIYFDNHSNEGKVSVTIKSLLDRDTNVKGFIDQLIKVGWMKENNGMLEVINFDYHISETAKTRAMAQQRKAKSRGSIAKSDTYSVSRSDRDQNVTGSVTKVRPEQSKAEENKDLNTLVPLAAPKARAKKKDVYTEDFERIWAKYPKRGGGNSKADAFKAFNARLKEDPNVTVLEKGVERYAFFIRADEKEGTVYVKQAATFFGPGEHYKEPWQPPEQVKDRMTHDKLELRELAFKHKLDIGLMSYDKIREALAPLENKRL